MKRLIFMLMAIVVASSLIGCKSSQDNAEPPQGKVDVKSETTYNGDLKMFLKLKGEGEPKFVLPLYVVYNPKNDTYNVRSTSNQMLSGVNLNADLDFTIKSDFKGKRTIDTTIDWAGSVTTRNGMSSKVNGKEKLFISVDKANNDEMTVTYSINESPQKETIVLKKTDKKVK